MAKANRGYFLGPQAYRIVRKLGATIDPNGAHKQAFVYFEEKLVATFGIRHDQRKNNHTIPENLHVNQSFARGLAECTKSSEEYFEELRKRKLLPLSN